MVNNFEFGVLTWLIHESPSYNDISILRQRYLVQSLNTSRPGDAYMRR